MVNIYKNLINNESIIFDIGSNIGLFTKAICDECNYHSIHLFEPSKKYYNISKNVLKNYKNLYFYNIGCGNKNKEKEILYLAGEKNYGWNTFLIKDPKQEKDFYKKMNKEYCNIYTLDYIFDKYNINKVDFIKIDVEGYEVRVIEGGYNTIKKFKPYLLVEVAWGKNHPEWNYCKEIYNKLFSIGYKKIDFDTDTRDILFYVD